MASFLLQWLNMSEVGCVQGEDYSTMAILVSSI